MTPHWWHHEWVFVAVFMGLFAATLLALIEVLR